MKKVSILFVFMFLGFAFLGFSQSATAISSATGTTTDFFAGKWEITIAGTPNGDAKMVTELVRKEGKLTGVLKDPTGTRPEPMPITKINEEANKITIFFNTDQAGEIGIDLTKVDDDHLKGQLMGMFDSTAVRIKK